MGKCESASEFLNTLVNSLSEFLFMFWSCSNINFTQKHFHTFQVWKTLVDIPAVNMPTARSLKTCDNCGIVLCDKTAHLRVTFYCGQPKTHLRNNHAVQSASSYARPVRWMDYLGKGEVLTNTDLDRIVNNI